MSVEKWVAGAGVGLSWTTCVGTEFTTTSLTAGNAILSSVDIDNSSALDLLADVSVSLASMTTGSGLPYLGVYFYPLNEDGSTYGDGQFGSAAAGPPPTGYYLGSIPAKASNTGVVVGSLRGIWLPPGHGSFVFYNNLGGNTASSGNAAKYRTYNRQVV